MLRAAAAACMVFVLVVVAAGCKGKDSPPEVTFTLDKGQSARHYGVKLTFKGGGHTIEESGHTMMISVELEHGGKKVPMTLESDEWKKPIETHGVRWQVVEADGFDPKTATFQMYRP